MDSSKGAHINYKEVKLTLKDPTRPGKTSQEKA